jgi:hypothetical protein
MIPMIRTQEQIELAFRRRGAYQRPERIKLLEECQKQLNILKDADKISREDYFRLNGQILPVLSEERWRLSRSTQPMTTTPQSAPTG